jgi:hypothetical protein
MPKPDEPTFAVPPPRTDPDIIIFSNSMCSRMRPTDFTEVKQPS